MYYKTFLPFVHRNICLMSPSTSVHLISTQIAANTNWNKKTKQPMTVLWGPNKLQLRELPLHRTA